MTPTTIPLLVKTGLNAIERLLIKTHSGALIGRRALNRVIKVIVKTLQTMMNIYYKYFNLLDLSSAV